MAEYIKREAIASKAVYMHGFGKNKYVPLRAIEEAPAADVAPVEHGRWIKPTVFGYRAFDIPHCSVCETVPCGVDENTKYCANCGAKMDLE